MLNAKVNMPLTKNAKMRRIILGARYGAFICYFLQIKRLITVKQIQYLFRYKEIIINNKYF